jgi:hypothetical protein
VEALHRLGQDVDLRRQFGAAGVERIGLLSNPVAETDLLEEIMAHVLQGQPLKKVAERNQELLHFTSALAMREKRVLELETPGLWFSCWKGACHTAYRQLRSNAGRLWRAMKASRKISR